MDIISAFIDVGGCELVMAHGYFGTALHEACGNENVTMDIISALIDIG